MSCARTIRWTLTGLLVIMAGLVFADGFRNPPEGGAAMGRAGTRLTQGTDATATIHNPANLMDLDKATAMPSFTVGYIEVDYNGPLGTATTEDPLRVLPGVFANWPVSEDVMAGVAFHIPYGQFTSWPKAGALQFAAPYYAEMKTINVSPVVATRLSDSVTVGVGVDLMWSQLDIRQRLPWGMMTGIPALGVGEAALKADGYGVGAHAGLTWSIDEAQRFSVVYQSAKSVDYEGDFEIEGLPPGMVPLTPRSDAETEIDFPSLLAAAYGVRVRDDVYVELQVEWIEHSRFESLDIDAGNNTALLAEAYGTPNLPQDWDDTVSVSVGCDWDVAEHWVLRGGALYLPTPVPEETLMPQLPEGDKYIFTLGAGRRTGSGVFDVCYGFVLAEDVTVDDPRNPVPGTYETDQHIFSVSYSQTF